MRTSENEKSAYEVIDSIIFELNEIKQIDNEESVKKQLDRYLDKIHLIYHNNSLLLDVLRALTINAEVFESTLRPNYPITELYRKKITLQYKKFKSSVLKLAGRFHESPLFEHIPQDKEEELFLQNDVINAIKKQLSDYGYKTL